MSKMRYLINPDNGMFLGYAYCDMSNVVDTPLKPLGTADHAYWKEDHWEYDFNSGAGVEKEVPDVDYFLDYKDKRGYFLETCAFDNGELCLEHTGDISILIPSYNKKDYLQETVESALKQNVTAVLVLLMGEDVVLKDTLEEMGATCFVEDPMDVVKARNYLFDKCKTDWLIFLDADDTLADNYVSVVNSLEGSVIFSLYHHMEDGRLQSIPYRRLHALNQLLVINMTALMHRDVFEEIGFNEAFSYGGEDLDFWIRLIKLNKYKITYAADTWYNYRNTDDSLMKQDDFIEGLWTADLLHRDFLLKCVECNKNFFMYSHAKTFLENLDDPEAFSWLRGQFGFESNREIIMSREINNKFIKLFRESQARDTDHIYYSDTDEYIKFGDFDVHPALLEGRLFDCVFIDIFEWDYMAKTFQKDKKMIIHKDVYDEIKDMGPYLQLYTLLSKYSCFVIGCDQNYTNFTSTDEILEEYDSESYEKYIKINTLTYPNVQHVTFFLDYTCNQCCDYCCVKGLTNSLSEEDLIKNLDVCMEKAKALCEKKGLFFHPQISGGEPTMWSETLQQAVLDRMKDYPGWMLFTNGYDLSAPIAQDPNCQLNIHHVDWKDFKFLDEDLETSAVHSIIIREDELDDVEKLMQLVKSKNTSDSPLIMYYSPDLHIESEEFYNRFYELYNTYDVGNLYKFANWYNFLQENGHDATVAECLKLNHVWGFNCQLMLVTACCQATEAYSVDEFDPDSALPSVECANCHKWSEFKDPEYPPLYSRRV